MVWIEKKSLQEHFKELLKISNCKQNEYGTVMLSEASEIGLEHLVKISWKVSLQMFLDKSMNSSLKKTAHLSYLRVRTEVQVWLEWCMMGIKRTEYEASNDSRSKDQELELMGALRVFIARDDSEITYAKRTDAH